MRALPFVVAEISSNHRGSLSRAERLIQLIAEAGADAVKFQTFTADSMTLPSSAPEFRISDKESPWFGRSLYDLYSEAHTPWSWFHDLFEIAREFDIEPLSTPFDRAAVDFLEALDISRFKIASFENGDIGLMRYVAQTGKPVLLSIGMLSEDGIDIAVETMLEAGCRDLTLLKCTSVYPAQPNQLNLVTIENLSQRYGLPIGFSDHTVGIGASIAACALGASVVEKHVVDSHESESLDASFSASPDELRMIVEGCRIAAQARGNVSYMLTPEELESAKLRRSLYLSRDLAAGDVLTEDCVRSLRPALGIEPRRIGAVLGKRARIRLAAGTPIQEEFFG